MDNTEPPIAGPSSSFTNQPFTPKQKGGNILLFSFLGFLLFGFGILAGFFIGKQHPSTITQSPLPSPTVVAQPTATPSQILPSPTPAFETTKSVTAGQTDSDVFTAYTVAVPAEWTDARETTVAAGIDKLTLTKSGYTVTIYQAPMGGQGCVYPEDPSSTFAQTFSDFVDINGKSGQFRRSWNSQEAQTTTYNVCQKGSDNSYGTITEFGAITVVAPNPANQTTLIEIDGIIASLTTQ
ncbi:MAG TPA: hypothetical protein VLF20_02805 [Patescibacteria group bacterium]|nr:hypothetical protein [Patescibacteria group bacterium]